MKEEKITKKPYIDELFDKLTKEIEDNCPSKNYHEGMAEYRGFKYCPYCGKSIGKGLLSRTFTQSSGRVI